ncbi:MAG TPA: efflux RND transporter periplasmic adaptor subunit [Candidatus Hydrogenedentes bacterium]|nr:efflux RND transporter periplasmic adaptor subunit [Candidatus Hydrogenedentota bacterium]HQH53953.1 efflux RND transporter periplasmic adaptor subunit [Candidatus Hydrogenedentota bacterium]
MGIRAFGWLILLVAVVAPVVYLSIRESVVEVTAAPVTRGRVEQTVTAIASGTVMSKLDSLVASGFMGTVVGIPFEEGDRVEKDDVLVELNHVDLDAQVALAEANLRVGRSMLERARLAARIYKEIAETRVSQTGAQLKQAESDFGRVKALADRGALSTSDFDKAALALRVAEDSATAALASQRENLVRDEEIRSAEASIEQLEAAVAAAKATREKAFVRAPFDGVVARVIADLGASVTVGMPLVQLVRDEELYIEAPFDEANMADIKLGQKVRITLDAYRGEEFTGRVSFIWPVVQTLTQELTRTLNIKVVVEEDHERLLPGMSADLVIIVDEKEGVLFAPSEALMRQQYAYVIENGRAVRREVTTGIGNWETVEIRDGLKEGDVIITSLSIKELKDGVKVAVVDELEDQ